MEKPVLQQKNKYYVNPFMGSYKLSQEVLYKMISASSTYAGTYAGASRYETLALIYLTRIADASGLVERFKATDFIKATGCSRREAFSLMTSLELKGYVSVAPSDWKCRHDIRILNNDFSTVTPKSRYLNTNRDFFWPGRCLNEDLMSLSLTSLRLLLYLLYNYSQNYGYHASYITIMTALGIKHKYVVNRCLEELNEILWNGEDFYKIREDLKNGLKYGYIDVMRRHYAFVASEGIIKDQDSYFKRKVRLMAEEAGCAVNGIRENFHELTSHAFAVFQGFLDKGTDPDDLCSSLVRHIGEDGVLDELTLYHVTREFSAAFA